MSEFMYICSQCGKVNDTQLDEALQFDVDDINRWFCSEDCIRDYARENKIPIPECVECGREIFRKEPECFNKDNEPLCYRCLWRR